MFVGLKLVQFLVQTDTYTNVTASLWPQTTEQPPLWGILLRDDLMLIPAEWHSWS